MLENDSEYIEQREQLIDTLGKSESALRDAVEDLTGVARKQLTLAEHIHSAPLPWMLGAFCVGIWLGVRR